MQQKLRNVKPVVKLPNPDSVDAGKPPMKTQTLLPNIKRDTYA